MKVAERWKDSSQQSPKNNRFDIFTDVDDTFRTPAKRQQPNAPTGNSFRLPNAPLDLQTAKEIPSRTYDALDQGIRRYSFPAALSKRPEKANLGKLKTRGLSPTKTQAQHDSIAKPTNRDYLSEASSPRRENRARTPFSLWDYLQVELAATDSDEAHDFKRERVKNFLLLPDALERTLMFGFIVCLDSFLYIFTILPLRIFRSILSLLRRLTQRRESLKSSEKVDLLKGGLILMTCLVLHQLDASRIYHNIRGQAAIKLYVLYNVLEIGDKLFCALGQDILDCLFSKSTFGRKEDGSRRHIRPLAFLALAVAYNVLHTILLFYQLVTLNVTINSFSNALMTLLLSNQFVEIKGSVFKKFEKEGLFQITCADMVERFQLFLMLLIIGLRNTVEMAPPTTFSVLTTTLGPLVTVLGSEVLVDWLKHAFITKFNHVRPTIYGRFTDVLCRDYVKSARDSGDGSNTFVDQSPAISRRIGLPVLPLVCLAIRSAGQIFSMVLERDSPLVPSHSGSEYWPGEEHHHHHHHHQQQQYLASVVVGGLRPRLLAALGYGIILLLVFATAVVIKLSIGVSLIRFAHGRYSSMQTREAEESLLEAERKRKDVYKGLVEVDGDTKMILNDKRDNLRGEEGGRGLLGLERYSMISKRIW